MKAIVILNKLMKAEKENERYEIEFLEILSDLGAILLIILTIFAIVYIIMISADAEYEISQEKERAYFDRVEEIRNANFRN